MNKQKGHEGDVERLIEEHQPQLKAFIHRRVSSKEDAEDILQDVFYQLVKAVSNTLNPIEQVTSWLYRVTRNTIINKGKKKSEEPEGRKKDVRFFRRHCIADVGDTCSHHLHFSNPKFSIEQNGHPLENQG